MDEQALQQRLIEVGVPGHIVEGIAYYVIYGRPTGSFLRAVLEDRFIATCTLADDINQQYLWEIAIAIYNELPAASHGSPEKVTAWIESGGLTGMAVSKWLEMEKKYLANELTEVEA